MDAVRGAFSIPSSLCATKKTSFLDLTRSIYCIELSAETTGCLFSTCLLFVFILKLQASYNDCVLYVMSNIRLMDNKWEHIEANQSLTLSNRFVFLFIKNLVTKQTAKIFQDCNSSFIAKLHAARITKTLHIQIPEAGE